MYRNNNNLRGIPGSGDLGNNSFLSGTFVGSNNIYQDKASAETRKPNVVLIAVLLVGIPSYIFGVYYGMSGWKEIVLFLLLGGVAIAAVFYFYWKAINERKESRIRDLDIEGRLKWLEEIHF